jgi:hypothetical protein
VNEYLERKFDNQQPAPFKLNTGMIELLEPVERIQVEKINQMMRSGQDKKTEAVDKLNQMMRPEHDKKREAVDKLSILTCIIDKFVDDSEAYACKKSLEIFQKCMNIFLWHFESSYYEDNDLIQILQRVKEVFKHFDEIMISEFADWYAKYSKKIIKRALFRLCLKIIKKCRENKSSFKKYLKTFLGEDKRTSLNLGNLFLT